METDETEDDATMTVITPDSQSFVPTQPLPPDGLPDDDISDPKVRKSCNSPLIADTFVRTKKISTRGNPKCLFSRLLYRHKSLLKARESSPPPSSAPKAVLAFRYHSRDKPSFIVQV